MIRSALTSILSTAAIFCSGAALALGPPTAHGKQATSSSRATSHCSHQAQPSRNGSPNSRAAYPQGSGCRQARHAAQQLYQDTALAGYGLLGAGRPDEENDQQWLALGSPLNPLRLEGQDLPTDEPMQAYLWRRLHMVDENGSIAPDAWQNAEKQREANLYFHEHALTSNGPPPPDWISRGPNNVTGRSRVFLVHPTQTNRMWTAGVDGGIWYSSDSGTTWAPVDDRMANLAINCMTIDPANPSIMYAGTGEGYFNGDAVQGAGLFKSTDSGVTWVQESNTTGFNGINRIAVDPSNDNVILMTTLYGGIYRSADGGSTWSNPWTAQDGMCVAFDPSDGTQAVASVLDYDFNLNTWFTESLYSTDSGQTWAQASGPCSRFNNFSDRIEMAYAPSNPSIVYAETTGGVYTSTDGGHSYVLTTTSNTLDEGQLWYDSAIWVDPTNPNFLVICRSNIYKSTNGGATFTQIASGYIMTSQPHPDAHFVNSAPGFNGTTNTTVYVTTDGGPFVTSDIYTASTNSGWSPVGVQDTGQYYSASGEGVSGRIIGGLQDNGTLIVNTLSGNSASLEFGGDGGFSAIDPSNVNYMYGEYVYLYVQRTTNGGTNGNYIYSGLGDAGGNANFIAPLILDPNNVNRLLGGGLSLWVCNNAMAATPTWSSIKGPGTNYISAIAVAPGNSNIIWVGQDDGAVFMTTNGTSASPTWTTINNNTSGTPLPDRYIGRILIDPAKSNIVYVGEGGFTANNLWKTTDGGVTWTSITGSGATGLPNAPINAIARDPNYPNTLYVGTEVGVFGTTDGGSTWSTDLDGPNNAEVDELNVMANSNSLLAATHGRGIWTADLTRVAGLTITPSTQTGGLPLAATVALDRQAPPGGSTVLLFTTDSHVQVPTSVTVPAGQTSLNF
ncbi:MAG TPA: hypothetical protein VGS41_14710, partial [Chthonomonadales bacterium]|nr:hypothetical protein [Chthonomonadales bacterium]